MDKMEGAKPKKATTDEQLSVSDEISQPQSNEEEEEMECLEPKMMKIDELTLRENKEKNQENCKTTQQMTPQAIADLHKSIDGNDIKAVEKIISEFAFDEYANMGKDDENKKSAVATSLIQFEKLEIDTEKYRTNQSIYILLITNGFKQGLHEITNEIVTKKEKQNDIFRIRKEYCIESKKYPYLNVLRSKCRLHINTLELNEKKYFQIIMAALEELVEIVEIAVKISTLLKIISFCRELKIIFDFDKTSTDEIDPRDNKYTSGSCYYSTFCITIGAKNLLDSEKSSEVLGTMAHEFCHLAMYLLYKNGCKPYEENDEDTKNKFGMIVNDYKKRFDCKEIGEEIVEFVFKCYEEDVWHAELIVRVPHMIAHYKHNNTKLKQIRREFIELFNFYDMLIPRLDKNITKMEMEQEVKEINNYCGLSEKLQQSIFNLKDDAIEKFENELDSREPQAFHSNCAKLTMKLIYEKSRKLEKINSLIFATLDHLKNKTIAELIDSALGKYVNIILIVDCDEIEQNKYKSTFEKCQKIAKIIYVSHDELNIEAIESKQLSHKWSDLTEESQNQLLQIKVNFQGVEIDLHKIWFQNCDSIDSIPIDELSKEIVIKIGEKIEFKDIHVERKYVKVENWNRKIEINHETSKKFDELLKDPLKVFVLADVPGNGKSIEFKFLSLKLKEKYPMNWIFFIDLKKHTKNFPRNSTNSSKTFNSVEDVSDFLVRDIFNLNSFDSKFVNELFKKDRVVVLMDGFDEIYETHGDFVMKLACGISENSNNQLWMASRLHLVEKLENKLKTKAWMLTEFSKSDREKFLQEMFNINQAQFKNHDMKFKEFNEKVENFIVKLEAEKMIRNNSDDKNVTNPLLLYMIAEILIDSPKFQLQTSSLFIIHENFVQKTLGILLTKGKQAEKYVLKLASSSMNILDFYMKIAVENKFKNKDDQLFNYIQQPCNNLLAYVGLLYRDDGGNFYFLHETFGEFFIAQAFLDKIFKLQFYSKNELKKVIVILKKTLELDNNKVILTLLDDSLENYQIYRDNDKSKTLRKTIGKYGNFRFYEASKYGCNNLVKFLTTLISDSEKRLELWSKHYQKDDGSVVKNDGNVGKNDGNVLLTAFRFQKLEKLQDLWSFAYNDFFAVAQIKTLLSTKFNDGTVNCFSAAIQNKDEKSFDFFLQTIEKILDQVEKKDLIDCSSSIDWNDICEHGNIKIVLERIKKFLSDQFKATLKRLTDSIDTVNKACKNQNADSINFLCIEVISTFGQNELKTILGRTTSDFKNVLMFAAQNTSDSNTFETILKFIEDREKIKNMLEQKDGEGRNVLMIANEDRVSFMNRQLTVSEIFREYFEEEEVFMEVIKNSFTTSKKTDILNLHNSIRHEDFATLKNIIGRKMFDEYAYNNAGQSAVATSLELWNLEIYEFLILNGFQLGPHENIREIVKGNYKRKLIFEICRKCAIESKKEHLTVLRSKCRLHFNSQEDKKEEYFQAIMTSLEELDEIANEISILLKILAFCPELKIIFDFNRTSSDEIDPRDDKYTGGSTYFTIFCVTIGAKNLLDNEKSSEVFGTMAHEFCHLAMYLMFNNQCKPYEKSDEDTKARFGIIVDDYKNKCIREEIDEKIVELVFDCYGENVWHAELIVRVPHMLAHYKGNDQKLKELRNNFSELFEFYEELMSKNMNEMKAELAVKKINEICGISSDLQTSVFNLKDDAIYKFQIDLESKQPQIYKSNCAKLTIQTIREKAMKLKKVKKIIFAKINNFEIEKIAKQIFAALKSSNEVSVIINCDEIDHKHFKIVDEICKNITINKKIVFVSNEKLKISSIECQEVNHMWSELTEESQKKLLDIKVNFQGFKVQLNEIWSKNLESVESVPLDELSKGKEIKIGKDIKFDEIHVERKFVAADLNDNDHDNEKAIAVNEIIKEIEISKVFVLSDAPGNGKTTEFKFLTFKLKENFKNRWILLIDLKMHTKNFEKDSEHPKKFNTLVEILDFLAHKVLKLKNFEREFFSDFFKNDRAVMLMDGVDEISPSYKNFVMNLIDGIRKITKNQLWIATRPHLRKELEEKLETNAWKLTNFSIKDQITFFEKIFKKHDLKYEEFHYKIESFLENIESWDKVTNPLVLIMIAELFIDNPNFQLENINLYKIYDGFVKKMFRKLLSKGKEAEKDLLEFAGITNIQESYRKIAVEQIFDGLKFNHLFKNLPKPSDDQLTRVGFIYNDGGDEFFFIHETFKEFFIAQTIIEKIFELKFHSKEELNEILKVLYAVMEHDRYSVIMKFLDSGLENFEIDTNCDKSKILIDLLNHNKLDLNEVEKRGYNNLVIILRKMIADNQTVMKI